MSEEVNINDLIEPVQARAFRRAGDLTWRDMDEIRQYQDEIRRIDLAIEEVSGRIRGRELVGRSATALRAQRERLVRERERAMSLPRRSVDVTSSQAERERFAILEHRGVELRQGIHRSLQNGRHDDAARFNHELDQVQGELASMRQMRSISRQAAMRRSVERVIPPTVRLEPGGESWMPIDSVEFPREIRGDWGQWDECIDHKADEKPDYWAELLTHLEQCGLKPQEFPNKESSVNDFETLTKAGIGVKIQGNGAKTTLQLTRSDGKEETFKFNNLSEALWALRREASLIPTSTKEDTNEESKDSQGVGQPHETVRLQNGSEFRVAVTSDDEIGPSIIDPGIFD